MSLELEQPGIFEQFEQLIAQEDKLEIREFLNDQNISDVADLINEYPEYEAQIIANMAIHRAASVFKILDIAQQKDIVKELPSAKTAELLNELPADDRTDFLEELPKAAIRDLIKLLDPEERKITLSLLGYPEDSVGRLMTPDYVYVYLHNTVNEVFATIRKHAKNSETIDVIYVIDHKGELIDDIRIRDVILASPDKRVDEIIDGRVVSLNVQDDQEHASQVFKMNNRVALPVVDDNNILLGIVTIDDMLWVANEEFSEDMQKMGGTEALNEPYLDIPFQHASPEILKAMRRPAAQDKTLARIAQWRAQCPELALRSTFIVGFPGETDSDFTDLLDWLDEAELDRVGCFKYEPVRGAASNALPNPVPDDVKQERWNVLMASQQKISARKLKRKVGTRQQVIVDEIGPTVAKGRSRADAPEIDGAVYLSSRRPLRVGEIVTARIERSDEYDLHGSVAGF